VRGPSHADYASDGCQHWMLVSTGRSRIGQSCRVLTSSWRAPHDVGAEPVYRSTELIVSYTCHPRQWHPGHAYRPNVLHHYRGAGGTTPVIGVAVAASGRAASSQSPLSG